MLNPILGRIGRFFGKDAKRRTVKKRQNPQAMLTKQGNRSRYHCVEVHGGNTACEAAKSLEGTRFLPDEAPGLPVPGCNTQNCMCRYVHHDDRREDDRRNPYRHFGSGLPGVAGERRARNDRRKSPENAFKPSIAA
jgi:hypothetical protein